MKATEAPALLVMVALPAVPLFLKFSVSLLVMVALPAVLLFLKVRAPLLLIVALPAVLPSKKSTILLFW
jgi:hypothetical protein